MTSLKNRIIELRNEGKSYRDIVDELGCSKSSVSYHLNFNVRESTVAS